MDNLSILLPPFLICVILTGIHGYLGIHVLARHVIFVDLAMAQIAALGTTVAFLRGYEPGSNASYFLSLGFTLFGATVFALTRSRKEKVPHEAIIGLVYAIATAMAILLADQAAHGTEHLKNLLAGSIVWVTPEQITKTFLIYAVLGIFHYIYRDRFLLISNNPEKAHAQGINVRWWDFLFYASFGIIITSSVQVAGVLLVFCYLIAPAVVAVQFADSLGKRLAIGWTVGVVVSAIGLFFSFDRPSGPTIILFFAIFLLLTAAYRFVANAQSRVIALAKVIFTAGILSGLVWGILTWLPLEEEIHSHGEPEHALGNTEGDLLRALSDDHDNVRASAAEALGKMGARAAIPELRKLLIEDSSPAVKEKAAIALGAMGAKEAIPELILEAKKEQEDEWVRLHAAQSLQLLEAPEAQDLLRLLAETAKLELIRDEARRALNQRTNPR